MNFLKIIIVFSKEEMFDLLRRIFRVKPKTSVFPMLDGKLVRCGCPTPKYSIGETELEPKGETIDMTEFNKLGYELHKKLGLL